MPRVHRWHDLLHQPRQAEFVRGAGRAAPDRPVDLFLTASEAMDRGIYNLAGKFDPNARVWALRQCFCDQGFFAGLTWMSHAELLARARGVRVAPPCPPRVTRWPCGVSFDTIVKRRTVTDRSGEIAGSITKCDGSDYELLSPPREGWAARIPWQRAEQLILSRCLSEAGETHSG